MLSPRLSVRRNAEGVFELIQLDIVVPAASDFRDQLSQLSTQYYGRQSKLSDFAAFAETHVQRFSSERCVYAVSQTITTFSCLPL